VSKKWSRSQTINHVWFQIYRKENFHDVSLPPGKWTRRESKQNWRLVYLDSRRKASKEANRSYLRNDLVDPAYYSSSSRGGSGYQTPREIREDRWRTDSDGVRLSKNDMRAAYKDLGGRKSREKSKYQTGGSARDRGGWGTLND